MASADIQVEDQRDDVPFFVHSEVDDYPFDPYEFRAYARLCRRAGNTQGEAYESVEHMATGCGMKPRKLRYCFDVLEACDFISRTYRKGQTTIIHLLPQRRWAPAKEYQRLKTEALKSDSSKDPRAFWKPKDDATPAPDAAPPLHDMQSTPAPDAVKGVPVKVLPSVDDDERAKVQNENPDDLLPANTPGFTGGYELKLSGHINAQRAWSAVCTSNDLTVVEAAGKLIDEQRELWNVLADARKHYRPHSGAFCIWVLELERDLRTLDKSKVASDLKASFEKAGTDFFAYYRACRKNPLSADENARGFSKRTRRGDQRESRFRGRDGAKIDGAAAAAAKRARDIERWRELGVEIS